MESHLNILDKVKKIHFIGIGGSGMCPIAEILYHKGYQITGSDMNESDTLDRIRSYGIPVNMGHRAENIGDAELVVYTAAIKKDNPELLSAKEKGIPVLERSVMLGMVTRRYAESIAVSGTHGKTTTTAMITQICMNAKIDPTAIIGGKLPFIGSNGRVGKSNVIICEACEYVDTFLQLFPTISVILNIDADHLDYFGSLENIIKSFHKFSLQTQRLLIINGDDPNTKKAVEKIENAKIITFGFNPNNDYYANQIIDEKNARDSFTLVKNGCNFAEIHLSVPGKHNIYNALAAAAVADSLGVPASCISESLHQFSGVHRRFEILGNFNGITIADDFAHHPTELSATLSSAMAMGFRKVWAIFQPHTFSRTYMLLDDFAKALSIPDYTILSEILAVRETNIYNIYAKDLAEKIPGSIWFKTFDEIVDYVTHHAQSGDLILTLGGGVMNSN